MNKDIKTPPQTLKAVLFDMDGVLYDSMPRHAAAWMEMCRRSGIKASYDDFFAYEGRTGASTIGILIRRQYGRDATPEEAARLYALKSELFAAMPAAPVMPGAHAAVMATIAAGAVPVLVTGSGQSTLLKRLERDFPGAFPARLRVTAADVRHGKPHPEPFMTGLEKAGVYACDAIAVDNAPLGVTSAAAAGVYTVGARTGPLQKGALLEAGADVEYDGMEQVARLLQSYI